MVEQEERKDKSSTCSSEIDKLMESSKMRDMLLASMEQMIKEQHSDLISTLNRLEMLETAVDKLHAKLGIGKETEEAKVVVDSSAKEEKSTNEDGSELKKCVLVKQHSMGAKKPQRLIEDIKQLYSRDIDQTEAKKEIIKLYEGKYFKKDKCFCVFYENEQCDPVTILKHARAPYSIFAIEKGEKYFQIFVGAQK